jgi:hypothetical protein
MGTSFDDLSERLCQRHFNVNLKSLLNGAVLNFSSKRPIKPDESVREYIDQSFYHRPIGYLGDEYE